MYITERKRAYSSMCEKNKNTNIMEVGGDMFQDLHQMKNCHLEVSHTQQCLPNTENNSVLSDMYIIYYILLTYKRNMYI